MTQSTTALQTVLVNLIDLGLISKQAHWNICGPNFLPVHTHLDELTDQLIAWQDEVAERITALGEYPDGRAATVASTSSIAPADAGAQKDTAVVRDFANRLAALSTKISAMLSDVEDDMPTQDVLIGIVSGLDKEAWFFRAQLA
ncbi:MAG: DNA starvation/stationary phase protection protein [Propionibacteriaceae bacterium]|jgi:starvation-inducible DNA-binding protein|nr:DNA starvation/stationary phase protection protein [Propionibacteriaceae bacterium]